MVTLKVTLTSRVAIRIVTTSIQSNSIKPQKLIVVAKVLEWWTTVDLMWFPICGFNAVWPRVCHVLNQNSACIHSLEWRQ